MSSQIEKIVKIYRQAVQFSSPVAASVLNSENSRLLNVTTTWSQNNIERKVKMSSEMFHYVDVDSRKVTTVGVCEAASQIISRYSPSSLLRAVVREVPAAGKSPKKQYLEVWRSNMMIKQFDLHSLDLHGDVYSDPDFSCFEWSISEEKILYAAEKKPPKTESFLSSKSLKETDSKESVFKGNEYLFSQDWGEQQVGKVKSVLVVADLVKEEVSVIEAKTDEDYFYGSGVWAPDGGVIAVAYVIEPRRLGRVYCTNRPSYIIHISSKGEITKLSSEGKSVFGPKLSPDNSRLIWFERDIGGPHHSCVCLVKYDWRTKQQTIVVDIVKKDIKCSGGQSFYGLYNSVSPSSCWLSDNKTVILSTQQRISVKTFAIDTDSGLVNEIVGAVDEEFSQGVLKVWKNFLFCWRSSLKCFPGVYMAKINPDKLDSLDWIALVPCKDIEGDYSIDIMRLEGETESTADTSVKDYSAMYFGPKTGEKVPLIVWSHGGPHGASTNMFNELAYFFSKLNFGMLMVNYRGSIGAGENSVNYLLGKVGYSDVRDIYNAQQHLLKNIDCIDKSKCVLYGGSHGGFLTLHLAGQYPDDFICCTALNPVTDLTQFVSSDIPDWAFVEGGLCYSPLQRMSGVEVEKLWKASPLYYVDKVKIPVLLLIGSKDLRVPPYQGINYYYSLKECGKVKTKLHLYEDNHPLAQSAHSTDFFINMACWFLDATGNLSE